MRVGSLHDICVFLQPMIDKAIFSQEADRTSR